MTLQQELERELRCEVRFDKISRALYSTDASVYQIEPVGVVVPKTREEIIRAAAICRRLKCPITMRGGGTSQAGQAIGEGLQIDLSKHYSRILEVNAEERWVRVEPGIVLDELNAQLAPLGLRFAPDISTASRATVGGMMANNSSGARSVLYGITIHHVLEQTVLLSDGSIVEFREIPRSAVPTGDTLQARCYQAVLTLAERHAEEIDRRFPKILRRVGGYNLDAFTDPAQPVNLAKIIVGSEGTLGIILEAKLRLVPRPKAKALMAKAGLKDGFQTTIWTRPSGSLLNPNPSLGAQLLQSDLAEIGIQAEIRVIEWGELIRRAKAGEHDLLFMGWAGDNGDPDNFLTPQFSCAAVKSGTNFARYCNADLDKLISAGKTTSEQGVRTKLYEQAQAQIQQQALWLPLAHPTAYALTRKDVQGYSVSPFGRQDYSKVNLK